MTTENVSEATASLYKLIDATSVNHESVILAVLIFHKFTFSVSFLSGFEGGTGCQGFAAVG